VEGGAPAGLPKTRRSKAALLAAAGLVVGAAAFFAVRAYHPGRTAGPAASTSGATNALEPPPGSDGVPGSSSGPATEQASKNNSAVPSGSAEKATSAEAVAESIGGAESDLLDAAPLTESARARRDSAVRAFNQRGRASVRETLSIDARYYDAMGDLDKAIDAFEALKRAAPMDAPVRSRLGFLYFQIGRYEAAIAELQEETKMRPNYGDSYVILGNSYLALNRLDAAKQAYDRAIQLNVPSAGIHTALYSYAFLRGDAAQMTRELEQMNVASRIRAETITGKLLGARAFLGQRANRMGQNAGVNESMGARMFGGQALLEALTSSEPQAQFVAETALRLDSASMEGAVALAIIGKPEALQYLENVRKEYPQATLLNSIWIPVAKGALETRAGNAPRALELLGPARKYEPSTLSLLTVYARGIGYLQTRSGNEAAAEFQKIVDQPGVAAVAAGAASPAAILYPLAHLGLARSYVVAGNLPEARKAYQGFLTLWAQADASIPIVLQAKREAVSIAQGPDAPRGNPRGARGQR
jgi:tetratricopeptide (TPR) repeat protein